jgi:hypothetical protein
MAKTQPVTNITTEEKTKTGVFPRIKALSGTPRAPRLYKYAGA